MKNKNNLNLRNKYVQNFNRIFKELDISYEAFDIDDDINYLASITVHGINIEFILFYNLTSLVLTIVCPNLYSLKPGDSTLSVLNALNKVNNKLANGSVTLGEDEIVSYRCKLKIESPDSLTKDEMSSIVLDITAAALFTHDEIKGSNQNE